MTVQPAEWGFQFLIVQLKADFRLPYRHWQSWFQFLIVQLKDKEVSLDKGA